MEKLINCPICNSKDFQNYYSISDCRLKVDDNIFSIVNCNNCKVFFINPRPCFDTMYKYYPNTYYNTNYDMRNLINDNLEVLKKKYNFIKKYINNNDINILDIGAQKGEFLEYCRRQGFSKVQGIDFLDTIPNPYNLPMKYGYAWDIDFPKNSFNLITMWHVFEHITYPNKLLKKIYNYLETNGILIIAIPNANSFNFKIMHTEDVPRHLFMYNKKSINYLLQNNNFKIIDIKYNQNIHSNSISGLLSILVKRKLFNCSAKEILYFYHNEPDKFESLYLKIIDRLFTLPLKYILPYLQMTQNFVIIAQKVI